jgi:hypothetical protein
MYLDAYNDEVLKLLKNQFHRDNYARLYPMVARYYNTFKKIVNLKSVLYKREAERYWYNSDGKTINDNYTNLLINSNIHSTMQLCNKLTNINNASLVRIIPDHKTKTIKYSAVPAEVINVTQDPNDPSEITSLLHRVTTQDTYEVLNNIGYSFNRSRERQLKRSYNSKYFYWTKDNYYILDNELKPTVQEKNPENINPYGVIPYQIFTNFPMVSGSIWNETLNDDLYTGTLQINVLQTYLNNALKLLGYLQLFISGIDDDEAKKLDARVSDALQPITTRNESARIQAVQMSNGVVEIRDTIHDIISEIADNHGVSFGSRTDSAQRQSGLALAIDQEQINNIREEQIPLYRENEKKLAQKTVVIANKEFNAGIDEGGSLSINFYEEEKLVSEGDKLKRDMFNLKNNIISVVDLYRQNDTDVGDDNEVLARIQQNKMINDELLDTFSLVEEKQQPAYDTEDNDEDDTN